MEDNPITDQAWRNAYYGRCFWLATEKKWRLGLNCTENHCVCTVTLSLIAPPDVQVKKGEYEYESPLCYCENRVWYHQPNCNCPSSFFEGEEEIKRRKREGHISKSFFHNNSNSCSSNCSCDDDYYGGNPDKPFKRKSECGSGYSRGDW